MYWLITEDTNMIGITITDTTNPQEVTSCWTFHIWTESGTHTTYVITILHHVICFVSSTVNANTPTRRQLLIRKWLTIDTQNVQTVTYKDVIIMLYLYAMEGTYLMMIVLDSQCHELRSDSTVSDLKHTVHYMHKRVSHCSTWWGKEGSRYSLDWIQ